MFMFMLDYSGSVSDMQHHHREQRIVGISMSGVQSASEMNCYPKCILSLFRIGKTREEHRSSMMIMATVAFRFDLRSVSTIVVYKYAPIDMSNLLAAVS